VRAAAGDRGLWMMVDIAILSEADMWRRIAERHALELVALRADNARLIAELMACKIEILWGKTTH
jgi:hypothetical protein